MGAAGTFKNISFFNIAMSLLTTGRRETSRRPTVRTSTTAVPPTCDTDQIEAVCAEALRCEEERRRIRSRTAWMRKQITQRDSFVQRLFTQTQAKQKLEKVSPSVLQQLRQNVRSLEHVHLVSLEELREAEESDRLWASRELEQELLTFFQHKERLDTELMDLREELRIAEETLAEAQAHIGSPLNLQRMVVLLGEETEGLLEKKRRYDNGRAKTGYVNTMLAVQKEPEILEEVMRAIGDELKSIEDQTQAELLAASKSDEVVREAAVDLRLILEHGQHRLAKAIEHEHAQSPFM
jgi:hypothetical protein